MANSKFSISTVLGWIKKFMSSMPSPLSGYDIEDAKLNVTDGKYSVLYQLRANGGAEGEPQLKDERGNGDITNIKGEALEFDVLVSAINVKDALAPIYKGLNSLNILDKKEFNSLMYLLLGDKKYKNPEPSPEDASLDSANLSTDLSDSLQKIEGADTDNGYNAAKTRGTGLLGVDLEGADSLPDDTVTFEGKAWSWKTIAGNYIKYSLECEAEDCDYGAIENQSLSNCQDLISEYLMKVGLIDGAEEVRISVDDLVKPILLRIKADLTEYYADAYNKYIDNETTAEKEQASETAEEIEDELFGDNDSDDSDNGTQNPSSDMDEEDYADKIGDTFGMSKQISVKLKKITASNEIQLLGLGSNYLPGETLDDLEDIIYQDEFMNTLTGDPQSFNIDVDDDGYDIEQCEECEFDPCDSLWSIMQNGIVMYRNLYTLHWMAKGNDMMKLHLLTEDLYSELIQEIDTLGELLVEKCGTVQGLDFEWTPIATRNYEFQESLVILKDFIQNYIDTIDYAYPNQTSDVQSTLDEWLRYWNKQMNYFIKGQEI